ncbi:hypothetical protein [Actinocrispum wychmicini]|uniref:Secreted protein n=1 Tax=Actinocrispum wychmicini TaxID=1213861 RepID=A0A4V2S3U1_9PSEU|nr:hypothetical protein [Actinocrispum wychmicini]TCO45330.1 hypothetical protein EV192_12194 [Actinocrispum wychmicini]
MTRLLRTAAAALAATTLLGLTVHTASAAPAAPPKFDFTDCPALPAGADPAQWRCENLVSTGTARFGALAEQPLGTMRLTFAEGRLDGKYAQVFGSLKAEPVEVPGGLFGVPGTERNPLLRLRIQVRYAGFSDFLSVGDRMGTQHLKVGVTSPLVPKSCTIGDDTDPIVFQPLRTAGPDVISTNPPVLRFAMADNAFAVPGPHGCGAFTHLLSRRLGVPAAANTNAMSLVTYVGLRGYP